jgi:hypothetical protein
MPAGRLRTKPMAEQSVEISVSQGGQDGHTSSQQSKRKTQRAHTRQQRER